jgi:putative transport protein
VCTHIHAHDGASGVRRILGVLALAKKYGAAAADDAAKAALELQVPTYRFLRRSLERRPTAPITLKQILALDARGGAVAGRLIRADVALSATPGMRLQFGDVVHVVGDEKSLERAEQLLGNSINDLNQTHFIPLFAGIAVGIIVGTMPIVVPGLPQPLRLGLAGGPLIVALVLGRIGHIGRLVFHMPLNANLAFREFGIALFFAAVGLAAGPQFFVNVFSSAGLLWLCAGLCVTVLPLLAVGVFARAVLNLNFTSLGGLIAGSVTDPPALAFVNSLTKSDAATLPYVTVYPVATLLRILTAQMCALFLVH